MELAQEQEFDLACWADNTDVYPALEQAASATTKINFINDRSSFNYQLAVYSDFNSYYTYIKPWLDNADLLKNLDCLLNWAENAYSNLFSPAVAISQFQSPYTYRYYRNTNSYVGVSAINNHVYYLGPDRVLEDVGDLSGWLTTASCR